MRFVISGYFGYNNLGDEAILLSEITKIKELYHDPQIVVLSGDPRQTKQKYNVDAIYRYDLPAIIKVLKKSDLFISGGGSLLQDRTSTRSLLYYLGLIRLAHFMGKKTFVLAQGWGPIKNHLNFLPLRRTLGLVDLLTFRDAQAFYQANQLLASPQKIFETGDPAFLLKGIDKEKADKIFKYEELNRDNKPLKIAVSLRKLSLYEETLKKFNHNLAENLDLISEKLGARIIFIIMQSPADLDPTIKVASLMKQPYDIIFRECSSEELMGIIAQMDYVIGLRLHSLIFAAASAVPSLGLEYDPKVRSFMEKIDMPSFVLEKVGSDTLYQKVADFNEKRDWWREKVKTNSLKLIAQAQLNFSLMSEYFPENNSAQIFGVRIDNVNLEQAKKKAEAMLTNGKNNLIVTPNPEMVMSALKDSELNHVINNVAALSIPDGAGLQWGSWLLGENLYHQTPGIELMNELLILANEKGLRLFLVGGKPGVAEKAAENIKLQFPKLVIAGVNDGFFTKFEESLVVQKIFDSKADLVFAGLGAGRQEKWLSNHLVELGARVAMGIGGSLDIWAGEKKRAPKWVQRIGKEWVYRLVLEPWRLRRQMAIPAFLMKAFQEKYSRIVNKNNKKV